MARRKLTEIEAAGSESFLDITMNLVGILIILVVVVGHRAKNAPVELEPAAPSRELLAAAAESRQLEQDAHRLSAEMATVHSELRTRFAERSRLSTLIAAVNQELAGQREALDDQSRARYDLDRDLASASNELARLEAQREEAERAAAPKTIEIENRPTPLGKTIDGKEAYFHLLHGRLAFMPAESLFNRMQSAVRGQLPRLMEQPELVDTVGPIEGFRLRYVLRRTGTYVRVSQVELIPVSSQLGEPVDEALAPGSDFRQALEIFSPHVYTITVVAYADSFDAFRKLKQELSALGYSVAVHPISQGEPLIVSLNGITATAQ